MVGLGIIYVPGKLSFVACCWRVTNDDVLPVRRLRYTKTDSVGYDSVDNVDMQPDGRYLKVLSPSVVLLCL